MADEYISMLSTVSQKFATNNLQNFTAFVDQGRHSRKCEVVIVFILVITIPVICGVAYKAYHAAGSQEILENDSRILENDPEMVSKHERVVHSS